VPRFVPRDVIAECSALMNAYGIYEVRGDAFGAGFHSDEWERNGKLFVKADFSTSEIYLRALPIFLARRNLMLIDNAKLRGQLASLERHVLATREAVKHPQVASTHDDLATAACGAIVSAAANLAYSPFGGLDPITPDTNNFQVMRLNNFIDGLARAGIGGTDPRLDGSRYGGGPRLWSPFGRNF
jgi:hypothetical protein